MGAPLGHINEACFPAIAEGQRGRERGARSRSRRKERKEKERKKRKTQEAEGAKGGRRYLHAASGQMTRFVPPLSTDVGRLPGAGPHYGPPTARARLFKMAEVQKYLRAWDVARVSCSSPWTVAAAEGERDKSRRGMYVKAPVPRADSAKWWRSPSR